MYVNETISNFNLLTQIKYVTLKFNSLACIWLMSLLGQSEAAGSLVGLKSETSSCCCFNSK